MQRRRFGAVVRLEVSSSISDAMLWRLKERLGVHSDNVYPVKDLLDLADSQSAVRPRPARSQVRAVAALTQRRLAAPTDGNIFTEIAQRDIVVQHPYDSFATSVEAFVQAAARDTDSVTLKTTVYERATTRPSRWPIRAVENGKQSVCVVELKARFDERRNIEWDKASVTAEVLGKTKGPNEHHPEGQEQDRLQEAPGSPPEYIRPRSPTSPSTPHRWSQHS